MLLLHIIYPSGNKHGTKVHLELMCGEGRTHSKKRAYGERTLSNIYKYVSDMTG